MVIHGLAGVGKTSLACTLPGPSAWVISEPGATAPILHVYGMNRVPRIVARNFTEFMAGGPVGHRGFAAFAAALPKEITWVVLDTLSTLLVGQHALHLAEAETVQAERAAKARLANKEPPGVDKFAVLDHDLNRARLVQSTIQSSGRNILYLAHTAPLSSDDSQNQTSTTAGRPVIPGQFRTYLEAWASGILYLAPREAYVRDDSGKVQKVQTPEISLTGGQRPLVKHKWERFGRFAPNLSVLLKEVGEWPR